MANISALATTSSAVTSTLLSALGITGWVLKDGMYNGCTFASFVKVPIVQNNPIVQNGTNLFASIGSLSGFTFGTDANALGKLFNTFLGTLQFSDEMVREIVRKRLPFSNRCNTENVGTGGYIFRMTLLFLGPDYQKAISNLENAINNPPSDPKLRLSLVHPTRGKISGITQVSSFRTDTTLAYWNAATVHITFTSEQTNVGTVNSGAQSTIQQFTNVLQAGLATVSGITATAANFQALVNSNGRIPTGQTSNVTYTESSALQTQSNQLADTLLNNINYIYKTSNTGAISPTLDTLTINYSKIPPSLNQSTQFSNSQIDIVMGYYEQLAESLITNLENSSFGYATNDLINQVNNSIAILSNIAILAIPNTTSLSYVVPYVMSIRTALVNNSIDMNEALTIINNNPQILSANYLPEGMVIQL